MKIQFNPKDFLRKFRLAATAVGKENYGRHITSVKIVADTRLGIALLATNFDMTIRVRVDGIVDIGGAALLPVKRLDKFLQLCKDASATLESTKTGVVLQSGTVRVALVSVDPKEFPDVVEFPESGYCEIMAGALQAAINRTAFAADKDTGYHCYTGVCFESDGIRLDVVATDGQSMAWQQINGIDCRIEKSVVPSATLALLEKVMKDKTVIDKHDDVKMAFRDNSVFFQCGEVTIFSRLAEERFPAWKTLVPNKRKMPHAKVPCGELQAAVCRAMICTNKSSPRITLTLDSGLLTIESRFNETVWSKRKSDDYRDDNYDKFESIEESGGSRHIVPVSYTGKPASFCIDPKRLANFLSAFKDDTELFLYLPMHADMPVLIVPENGYTYLIKPQNESANAQSEEEPDAVMGVEVDGLAEEKPMTNSEEISACPVDVMDTKMFQLISENEQLHAKAEHYKALLERAMRVIEKMKAKDRCVAFS